MLEELSELTGHLVRYLLPAEFFMIRIQNTFQSSLLAFLWFKHITIRS